MCVRATVRPDVKKSFDHRRDRAMNAAIEPFMKQDRER